MDGTLVSGLGSLTEHIFQMIFLTFTTTFLLTSIGTMGQTVVILKGPSNANYAYHPAIGTQFLYETPRSLGPIHPTYNIAVLTLISLGQTDIIAPP